MKVLATICARAGSKGLKNKNIKKLLDKELIAYTIDAAFKSEVFDELVLSTDSEDIKEVAKKHGLNSFFTRSADLARDESGKIAVIKDALIRAKKYYKKSFDYVIDLDVTAPLRLKDDIKKALIQCKSLDLDVQLSATKARKSPYFNIVEWHGEVLAPCKKGDFLCRQSTPKCYDLNASIYIFKATALLRDDFKVYGEKTGLYIMDESCAYDIDCLLDFKIVKMLLAENKDLYA